MSGPKYSRAHIRELQRLKQLERQLAEQVEQAKRKQVLDDILVLEKLRGECCSTKLLEQCEELLRQAESVIPESATVSQMRQYMLEIRNMMKERCDTTGDSKQLLKRYNNLKTDIQRLQNSVIILKELKKHLSAEYQIALQEKKEEEFINTEWTDTGEKIDVIPTDLQEVYYEVLGLLASLPDYEMKKKMIDESIMRTGDNAYKKNQLELRKKAILVELNSSQDSIKYLSLVNELQALYSILGWEAKQIPLDIADLEKALSEAKEEAEKKQKGIYIAECLHKVFQERGYTLVDDAIVSTTKGSIQKDYYEFGEDALINVSVSDSGQMLFEVVGDGTEEGMDETRAAQLESEMRRFCPDYAEIREILQRDYGISLEDERLCPPDKKYAKAVDVSEKKSERRAKRGKKMMHYDD